MPTLLERNARQTSLARQWRRAHREGNSKKSGRLFQELQAELETDPRFIARKLQDNQRHADLRESVLPLKFTSARRERDEWEIAKREGRGGLLTLLRTMTGDKRAVVNYGSEIHLAACRYEQHMHRSAAKLVKIKGEVVRKAEPAKTATECLKRLQRSLHSSSHVRAKAWAAMTPAALEALVRGNPRQAVPIFTCTLISEQLEPFLAGAIRYASRVNSPSQDRRDDLLVAVMLAYGAITGKPPTISRSPRNKTMTFLRNVERAYNRFLPKGFHVPRSHAKLDQLRTRAVKVLASKENRVPRLS